MKKVGRNDKCPCDSGKKYKLCCLASASAAASAAPRETVVDQYARTQLRCPDLPQIQVADNVIGQLLCRIPEGQLHLVNVTDFLNEEAYANLVQLSVTKPCRNIACVAHETPASTSIFESRRHGESSANTIILFRGEYRSFPAAMTRFYLDSLLEFLKVKP